MIQAVRPRRSALYIPGDKPRALEKARSLAADMLIFDLEDAVSPANKGLARGAVAAALAAGGFGDRELVLRVGGLEVAADFELASRLPLDGVLLPKVEHAEAAREAAGRTPHRLWCMIETPRGVLNAAAIAEGGKGRLEGFVAGTNDLAKGLRARHTVGRTPLLTALSLVLLAARANGLAAIDGVHLELDDAVGFEASCRHGAELGFDGKSLVHPSTIEAANRLFGPQPAELERAREIIAAWDAARDQGLGVARIGGAMVEQLHVDEALRLVALEEAIARRRS